MWWLIAACTDPAPPAQIDLEGPLVVAATASDDYSAGALAVLVPGGDRLHDVATLHGDAVVEVHGRTVFAIDRLGADAVRRYDALDALPAWEISTERGSNPHAVAQVGEDLLITRYEEAQAWIVDAATGDLRAPVSLADQADVDEIPEASAAVPDDGRVLVGLQRLDRTDGWVPAGPGRAAVVDPVSATVERVLTVGPNPAMVAHPEGGALVAASDGLWRVHASGEVLGPRLPDSLQGAVLGALAVADDGRVVAAARDCREPEACPEHRVVCLDRWDGGVVAETARIAAYLSDVAVLEDVAYVAARRGWEDPEGVPGGLVRMPLGECGTLPAPEDWLRGTFAPYDLAVRRSAGD